MTDADIIEAIIENEGGYVNDPADRGGPTKYGITLNTLAEYEGRDVTEEDVQTLTVEKAARIYRERYIHEPGFDRIKDGRLRAQLVDCAALHGVTGATRLLQRAVGVTDDGVFGILTEKAANLSPNDAYLHLCIERIKHMVNIVKRDPSQLRFLRGWINRATDFLLA